jgi:hypothetical protein
MKGCFFFPSSQGFSSRESQAAHEEEIIQSPSSAIARRANWAKGL